MQKFELKHPTNLQILVDRLVDLINYQLKNKPENKSWFPVGEYTLHLASSHGEPMLILFSMKGERINESVLIIQDRTIGKLTLTYSQFEAIVQAIDAIDGKTTEYRDPG